MATKKAAAGTGRTPAEQRGPSTEASVIGAASRSGSRAVPTRLRKLFRAADAPSTPRDTFIPPPGRPIWLAGDRRGVLLLHGFTGVPEDMGHLARTLSSLGLTVSVPRLPGHGTNAADFLSTGWRDWLRHSIDSFLDLRSRCESVSIGGLSMGGVLALILASMFEVERIALFAPAVVNSDRRILLTPLLKWFADRRERVDRKEYRDPGYQALAPEYWHYEWIGPAASLLKLQRIARRRLHDVSAPILTFVSRGDRSVPVEAADIVERRTASSVCRTVVLEDSEHTITNGVAKERVARETSTWFAGESG
ncbi:alpha/beta hydrolase [Salinispira pacifica]